MHAEPCFCHCGSWQGNEQLKIRSHINFTYQFPIFVYLDTRFRILGCIPKGLASPPQNRLHSLLHWCNYWTRYLDFPHYSFNVLSLCLDLGSLSLLNLSACCHPLEHNSNTLVTPPEGCFSSLLYKYNS